MFTEAIIVTIFGLAASQNEMVPSFDDPHFSGRNIALGQRTTQSGVYQGLVSDYAVDGNASTDFKHEACSQTVESFDRSWWKVYFDKPYTITGIIIYHANEKWLRRRSKNFTVTGIGFFDRSYLLYDDSEINQYKYEIVTIKNENYKYKKFRSLEISVPKSQSIDIDNGLSMLQLCEVQVFTTSPCRQTNTSNGVYWTNVGRADDREKYEVNDTISLVCNCGFEPNAPSIQRVCLKNGTWSRQDLSCKRKEGEDKGGSVALRETDSSGSSTWTMVAVGLISCVGGMSVTTLVWLAIWSKKYREKKKTDDKYEDLQPARNDTPSYDVVDRSGQLASGKGNGHPQIYEELT